MRIDKNVEEVQQHRWGWERPYDSLNRVFVFGLRRRRSLLKRGAYMHTCKVQRYKLHSMMEKAPASILLLVFVEEIDRF